MEVSKANGLVVCKNFVAQGRMSPKQEVGLGFKAYVLLLSGGLPYSRRLP